MKTLITTLAIMLTAAQSFADITPPVRWDVETGRLEPRPFTLSIRRGETLKIEPRFLSYDAPINLSGAAVEMRYATSYNMATHYSATGSVQATTGRVQIAWSDSLNPTNNSMYYEIRATSGTQILARAYGPLRFLGGMVGVNTGLVARTSLDWATVSQANGTAVLSNQMGSGATWSGSNWTFAAGSSGISADTATNIVLGLAYPLSSNPSNYCTIFAATNGLGGYVLTNDSRLTDARAPLAHSQPLSTITNAGYLAYSNSLNAVDVGAVAPIHNGSLVLTNGEVGVPQLTLQTLNDTESSALQFVYGAKTQLVTYADAVGFQRHTMAYSATPATMYDSENFLAGTDYLAPDGSGASLTGLDTNPSLTGTVANVAANLASVSNTAVSAVSSASVAQASADAAMSTGTAAQASASSAIASNAALNARVTAVETNHATLAQGANADAALSKVVAIEPVYTTNIVWMGELDGGGWDYVNGQATNAGWRLPTKDELVAKVMTDPGWINDMYWSGTETEPGNAYLVIAHDFDEYTQGQYLSVPKDGEYWAQAVRTVITTNLVWASLAQGAKADTAAQPNGTPATTNYSLAVSGGATLTGEVATLVLSSRVTVAVSSPLASISYDSTASGSGAQIAMEYWHAGGWTNECIDPCYTGSIYYAALGPGGMEGSSDVVVSNWAVKVWGRPENLNAANDFRGTVVSLDTPTAPEHGSTKAYVDARVASVTPAGWAGYDANGAATGKGGVDLAGKRLYLSPAYSILSVSGDGHWALQHNGRDVLTVQMDVQGCAISNATFGSTITIGVDTNTIQSAPWPEVCTDLVAGNWTAIADYASTNNGAFLDISFSNAWTAASFRVMQTGTNASTLVSAVTFVAPGLTIAGTNATWRTMDVLIPGGGTNTIRYLGAP